MQHPALWKNEFAMWDVVVMHIKSGKKTTVMIHFPTEHTIGYSLKRVQCL